MFPWHLFGVELVTAERNAGAYRFNKMKPGVLYLLTFVADDD